MTECRSCGSPIVFLAATNKKTGKTSTMPVDAETVSIGDTQFEPASGHVSHFSTCPDSQRFRGRK